MESISEMKRLVIKRRNKEEIDEQLNRGKNKSKKFSQIVLLRGMNNFIIY